MDNPDIEIGEAFDLVDEGGRNAVSRRDVKLALRALGLDMPRERYMELMARIEMNPDGSITKEMFANAVRGPYSDRDVTEDAVKAFRLMDEDDRGKIGFEELRNVASAIGERVTDGEIIGMLNAADDDGDGQVSLPEFLKLMDRARKVVL